MIACAALPQLLSGLCFYQGVRQTFPAGSLLSAVCSNVIAIGEIWWRQEVENSEDEWNVCGCNETSPMRKLK